MNLIDGRMEAARVPWYPLKTFPIVGHHKVDVRVDVRLWGTPSEAVERYSKAGVDDILPSPLEIQGFDEP